jgi:hypothetical protein
MFFFRQRCRSRVDWRALGVRGSCYLRKCVHTHTYRPLRRSTVAMYTRMLRRTEQRACAAGPTGPPTRTHRLFNQAVHLCKGVHTTMRVHVNLRCGDTLAVRSLCEQAEGTRLMYEVILRSVLKHLVDSATSEYLFTLEMFRVS